MRKYCGLLITAGETGHDEEEVAFDSYSISTDATDRGLVKIGFLNGLYLRGDDDDIPVQEIILSQAAFVSFAVTQVPTVTITQAEYDSLKETVDILGDSKTVADIRESIIELATEIITRQKAADAEVQAAAQKQADAAVARVKAAEEAEGEFVSAAELADLRREFEAAQIRSQVKVPDDAYTQALADEAEAGYDLDKLVPRRTPGTENLVISRDNQ